LTSQYQAKTLILQAWDNFASEKSDITNYNYIMTTRPYPDDVFELVAEKKIVTAYVIEGKHSWYRVQKKSMRPSKDLHIKRTRWPPTSIYNEIEINKKGNNMIAVETKTYSVLKKKS
jgi:hypothetical protein